MENLNTTIPQNVATMKDLETWYELQEQLRKVRAEEMALRKRIYETFFQEPKEGTNNYDLADGFVLKAKRVINREIDKGSLSAMSTELQEAGITLDDIVEWKPTLKTSAYRKLTEDQLYLFDQVLIIKDGSPSLEIVAPKAK